MITEKFIIATRADPKVSLKSISKDVGIYLQELQPESAVRCTFKNSTSPVNAIVASSTHIFAAQAEKAVIHVYSREKGNQESIVSFPERVHSLSLFEDNVLVLGMADGRIILWEVSTGRLVSTPAAHLQAVCTLATTRSHLVSGSEDSNIHVWSILHLLSIASDANQEPLRCFSDHKAGVTSLAVGHSASDVNICVSASKDKTIIVWNYHSGQTLRIFLLPRIPLCVAIDPCDRGVYLGLDDGTVQLVEFLQSDSIKNPLYDMALQSTPLQVTSEPWRLPIDAGSILSICLNYEGTQLLTGHSSGKVNQWNVGRRRFASEIVDFHTPVTNLLLESPFPVAKKSQISTVVKPKLAKSDYLLTCRFTGVQDSSDFNHAVTTQGIPPEMLENAISRFCSAPSGENHKLQEENEELKEANQELWKVIHELRTVQKKTWDKYSALRNSQL
ncbi:hypothetical protein K3495_g13762 [Podosphaera aphanis]|nr:hypothetical protein K3495_g13762 [Podosphaera aphanis]